MQSVDYYQNIYPPPGEARETTAEVIYSLVAPEAKKGGAIELPPGNDFSRNDQVLNDVQHTEYPIATLEPGYWRLDGTFALPRLPDESDLEVGWWSDIMSDGNCVLNPPQVITRVFDGVQLFNQIGISFDKASDNYCTEFEVSFFDAAGGVVNYEHITDNDSYYAQTNYAGFNIYKVVIRLLKTSKPFRYARVAELDFGVYLRFDNLDIKSLTLITEADYLGKSFPLPEFRLTILNKGRFDQLDPMSFAPFMQTRQKFEYRHGLVLPDGSVEYVECGSYILKEWGVSDTLVSFTATGKHSELDKSFYFDSSFEMLTVREFVKRIFPEASIDIDSPKIPAYLGNVNLRQALAYFAELSSCLVFEDRNNIVQFLDIINESYGGIGWNYHLAGSWRLGEKSFAVLDTINYQNAYKKPNARLAEYFNGINLMEYTVSTEERQLSKTRHDAVGSVEIVVFFTHPMIGTPAIEITPGFSLKNIIWRTMYMSAILIGNGTTEIVITGTAAVLTREQTFYPAPWNTGKEQEHPYEINLPMMIKAAGYEEFRDWMLERKFVLLAKRLNCDFNWRQNPAIRLGDTVNVQLSKSRDEAPAVVVRNEITYSGGALKGNTKVIREMVF